MTQTDQIAGYAVKRRSTRRWIIRIIAVIVIAATITYATIPLWLPTEWLTGKITAQLSAELNRTVHIDNLSLGWIKGVVLQNLTIKEHAGWPNQYLLRVAQVRCGLSPINILITGRVDKLEFTEPQLYLAFDQNGRVSIEDLIHKPLDKLPSLNYIVHKSSCQVMTPYATQAFRIDDLKCRLQPATGLLKLTGNAMVKRPTKTQTAPASGQFNVDAEITVPRLKRDLTLGGQVNVQWKNLSITDLPVPLIPQLPIKQVAGTTTGKLTFSTQPDLGIDYNLNIKLDGVKITRQGIKQPAQVPDAQFNCRGHWDPNNDLLVMKGFYYETQALRVYQTSQQKAPAMVIDRNGKFPFDLQLEGQIKDWTALRSEFPEVDAFTKAINAQITGKAKFKLQIKQSLEQEHFTVTVDGKSSKWIITGHNTDYLHARAGIPKQLRLQVIRDRQKLLLTKPHIRLTVGDLSLSASSKLIVPKSDMSDLWPWLDQAFATLQGNITVKTKNIKNTAPLLPFLNKLADTNHWQGPLKIQATLLPKKATSNFEFSLTMDKQTSINFRQWFNKPAGKMLTLNAGMEIPHTSTGLIDNAGVELNYGASKVTFDRQNTQLRYTFDFLDRDVTAKNIVSLIQKHKTNPPIVIDASLKLPIQIDRIKDLIPLVPRLLKVCNPPNQCHLAGSANIIAQSSVSYRPDDWLINHQVNLKADQLAIKWTDLIDKPAGTHMDVTLNHRSQLLNHPTQQLLAATLNTDAGQLTGSIMFARQNDNFEHAIINANIKNVTDMLAITPTLNQRLKPLQLTGALEFEIDSLLVDRKYILSLSSNATDTGFIIPSHQTITKPIGIPATLELQWNTSQPQDKTQQLIWQLNKGQMQICGAHLQELSGELTTEWSSHLKSTPARQILTRKTAQPLFRSAFLKSNGYLNFNEPIQKLHPQFKKWKQKYQLAGKLLWDIKADISPENITLAGRMDAGQMNCNADLKNNLIPKIQKNNNMPAYTTFNMSLHPKHDTESYQICVRDLTVDLQGNSITTTGTLDLAGQNNRPLTLNRADCNTNIQIKDINLLSSLLPDAQIHPQKGGLDVTASAKYADNNFSLPLSRISFDSLNVNINDQPIRLD
ncbi:MAG: AsmA family protein, partial [Planctomycetota bacterium]